MHRVHLVQSLVTWISARLAVAVVLALVAVSPTFASEPGRLADWLPGYEVARCVFPQGKLVLEHSGEFVVVREGDFLPGAPRVKVHEISAHRAVLFEAAQGAVDGSSAVPNRIFKIDLEPDGTTRVTLLGADLPRVEESDLLDEGDAALVLTPAGVKNPKSSENPGGDNR